MSEDDELERGDLDDELGDLGLGLDGRDRNVDCEDEREDGLFNFFVFDLCFFLDDLLCLERCGDFVRDIDKADGFDVSLPL